MYFTTLAFWTDLAERTVSTVAQAALGFVTAAAFVPSIESTKAVAITAGTAGAIAVLKAFAAGRGTPAASSSVPDVPAPLPDPPAPVVPLSSAATVPTATTSTSAGGVTSTFPAGE